MLIFAMTRGITKGQVLRYMFMPQIIPRIYDFYRMGFSHLAYIIALVYRALNILPRNHYVLRTENRNKIGLRMVLAAAGAELKFTWRNIDQIIIYFAVIVGLIILVGQVLILIASVMMNPALAAMPANYGEFFATAHERDVAYRLMMTVFGVPEIFGTNVGAGVGFGITRGPYHIALHNLFQLYSMGLLVIAVLIVSYYIFAVVAETAQTGVPFGNRYNHVWAPIRLVLGLGLLIPMGYGLNAAQWITLYAAKYGSDFATKGWVLFNTTMNQAYLNDPAKRVGTPNPPDLTYLAGFLMVADACEQAYEMMYTGANKKDIKPYLVKNTAESTGPKPVWDSGGGDNVGFQQARDYFNGGDIIIRFGEYSTSLYGSELGNVYPYCGDIIIFTGDAKEPGALRIQDYYYNLILSLYSGSHQVDFYGRNFSKRLLPNLPASDAAAALPPGDYKKTVSDAIANQTDFALKAAVTAQAASPTWVQDQLDAQQLGWAGAGISYNRVAQINGSLVTAVNNVPSPRKWPSVMEQIKREQLQQNTRIPREFSETMAGGRQIQLNSDEDRKIGTVLATVYDFWKDGGTQQGSLSAQSRMTGNFFIDVINTIFGTRGLFDMCKNADIHPLAQLSILGKGLVEASIRNITLALGLSFGSLLPEVGSALGAASSILLSIATITITMGFMLFYVLPFMPFLYFFFAVGGWVKGCCEAMVGVPLWAIAHLRIDGEGMPGDAAMQGYYLILEIFLRPLLIVFGFLSSIIVFSAMVKVLNEVFSLVVVNLSGHDEGFTQLCGQTLGGGGGATGDAIAYFRGPIDELFFTIIYAIIVYMIGLSCFKLIDLIPNNILRYMGESVNTFNDMADDPAQGMMKQLSVGTGAVSNTVFGDEGIVKGGIGTISGAGKAVGEFVSPPPRGGGAQE